ncbi:ATP-binding protein (plasmid) [Bradyrhizobium sp. CCGUVB1N3]|uniref:AAA family ATPase n=1 Tax=Bradyrhizobium sp. CCGUVB1N3 TaxID=2949629 RepID=UPI0020B403FC|nr:ATP-binding protein [Bradyrhizobium sp. CCGUVB1N3]MCP3477717.1 ATP-binding protein [Bradyrhizobium sp. CCGUVB1N3]
MPSADQLKALIKAFAAGDDAQFHSIAMQIAASEARVGHGKLAEELRELIDQSRARVPSPGPSPIPLAKPRGEIADLLTVTYPKVHLGDLVLTAKTKSILHRVVREHKNVRDIRAHGLAPRKKLLLVGPPGTGKTMTASAIAGELALPLFVVRLDRLITRYMGETAAKLRLIFDAIAQTRAVYLFDEFDSIGSERGLGNDVGEIRRVVNSFLQMVEQDTSDSVIIAATNHPTILDKALFRRFDDIVQYSLPTTKEIRTAFEAKIAGAKTSGKIDWAKLATFAKGLSYADVTRATQDALKHALIEGHALTQKDLFSAIDERKAALQHGNVNRK